MPKLNVVRAVIEGCGGSEADQQLYATGLAPADAANPGLTDGQGSGEASAWRRE